MAFFEQGSRVWFNNNGLWVPATTEGSDGTTTLFKSDSGEQLQIENEKIGVQTVTAMHKSSQEGVEDMAQLADLHEGSILYNMNLRYQDKKIYTYVGSILACINPYQSMGDLYSVDNVRRYNNVPLGELPPHIFSIASEAYYSMWRREKNQAVLISGESGAGKTESTKLVLRFLSTISSENGASPFEEKILQTSPVLESFGNAKTIYNNNSSRFGRFISVFFSNSGAIEGSKISDYLLEKSRVARTPTQERNFHIFYGLLKSELAAKYKLSTSADDYEYLTRGGVVVAEGIDDAQFMDDVMNAFELMSFREDHKDGLFSSLAAILILGNTKFVTAGGAQVADMENLEPAADLLGLTVEDLAEALTQIKRVVRGEELFTPLDVEGAIGSRDSMAMNIYARAFKWMIQQLNRALEGQETFYSVGVLDIFGFENFEHNSFEQFCINYANEKLQQYFNRHIFSLEQLEYNKEGIDWSDIGWVDNAECLDLIERRLGVLSILDEESRFPKGTDDGLLLKLHSAHGGSDGSGFYVKPRITNSLFGIKHFAGEVMYDTIGFLHKNRDTFRQDILEMLVNGQNDFVYDLFDSESSSSNRAAAKTSRKKPTVSYVFKESLTHLMAVLEAANPYFVRCLKPNMKKQPNNFEPPVVLNQLRYSGMLETVRIRKAGYPVRRPFIDFLFRYRVLIQNKQVDQQQPPKDQCGALLKVFHDGKDWQLGHNKVFMREKLEQALEKDRSEALKYTLAKIRAWILGYIQRKRYVAQRAAIIKMQSSIKAFLVRMDYLRKIDAATTIQKNWKGYLARQLRKKLEEEKRIEEERRREEERRKEEERLAELARLEAEAKAKEAKEAEEAQKRLEEARRRAEEEKKQKEEEAKRKQEEEQQKMAAAMQKAKRLEEEAKAREAEAARLAEEERIRKEEEEKRLKEEAEAKVQEEARNRELAAYQREQEEAERQAQLEAQLEAEEDLVEEEMQVKEGYLGMFQGVLKNLVKRWCVLHEGLFMWFRSKQDFIHAGWVHKMGGGTSTLGRKNWKKRWMVLRGGVLYYSATQDEDSEVLGQVDIQNAKRITMEEVPGKKENAFIIECAKRTYFMYCESPEELSMWLQVLNKVKGAADQEIQEMMKAAKVDPRHAQGTIDVDDILSVGPTTNVDVEGHPTFVIMSSERIYKFVAANQANLEEWVGALTPRRRHMSISSLADEAEVIERGWMLKTGVKSSGFTRRRWFVLRGDVISYYKTREDEFVVGTIPLNSLCSVIPPDEQTAQSKNDWTFTVHSKHKSFQLTCKTQADANRWINAIQDVIDNAPVIETQMESLIDELKNASASDVEHIYSTHKILTYSSEPLRAPLLPLPYGEIVSQSSSRTYETLQIEALAISKSLLPASETAAKTRYGSPAQPVELIKAVIQACFDVPKLRNEVYCQVVCQTTNAPNPGSPLNMTHWHLLAAMCGSFRPARKFERFLRFHLKRTLSMSDKVGSDVTQVATFCLEAMKRFKSRDFPPSTKEVEAIISGHGLKCTVHSVNDKRIDLAINSSTTCGDVISQIKKELKLEGCRNGFGLFEQCGTLCKYLDEKCTVADVLSKWEKYEAHGLNPEGQSWQLVFKLFSFYEPRATTLSSTEQDFLFEQAFESVMNRRFPADDKALVHLAALRTQYIIGDYEDGAYISDLIKVHPLQQPQLLATDSSGTGTLKKAATIVKGTLKGLGRSTLRRLRGGGSKKQTDDEAELKKVKDQIVEEWKKLKGLNNEQARDRYMIAIKGWDGYGSNLFEVEQTSRKDWPKELWLAISLEGVGIYPRGERDRLAFYRYETVLSFGAPVASRYKILVDGAGPMIFETNMVLEIAKLMKDYIKEIVTRRQPQIRA